VIYVVMGALAIIVGQLILFDRQDERRKKHADKLCEQWGNERTEWNIERQQLLDRIQAPSFDHLKQAEVKIIKAQNNEKEPPKLEQL
jgi:hypothetical protein